MKYFVAVLSLGAALLGRNSLASDVFSEGEKLLGRSKKPVVVRVNPTTEEATMFRADGIDSAALATLAKAPSAKQQELLSDKLASVEKRENEMPLFAGTPSKNESTPAWYGYYYGSCPWTYYRPIYVYYYVYPVTYYYSWHIYYGGYVYYWYL